MPEEDLLRQEFWTGYQPGFRASEAEIGAPEFYADVERHRYTLEPDIPELARFADWKDRDVVEAGCGIAIDGLQFARAGARYTGVDFSPTAIRLATARFEREGIEPRFVSASLTDLPLPDASFDLVYSMGVIHHIPDIERVISELHRVLRPGGEALVMVYHRSSFNLHVTIMLLRRLLIGLLLLPRGPQLVAKLTGERLDVLQAHRELLGEHGLGYLRDRQLFLNHNTDGPGNPYSQVYSAADARRLFHAFADVQTEVRFLHLRTYPGGDRLARTRLARWLGDRWGWHLWIRARKAAAPA